MRTTYLYKGHHSEAAHGLFKKSWRDGDCIIFCPPNLDDFSFIEKLPHSKLELHGELWKDEQIHSQPQQNNYDEFPSCGVFTSGTTDSSKLVLYSEKNLKSSVDNIFSLFSDLEIDNIFCFPQPFHTFGLTLGYAAASMKNLKLHWTQGKYSRHHLEKWFQTVNKNSMTLGTPTHFYDLLAWLKKNKKAAPQSGTSIIGGAKVKKQLWIDSRDRLNIAQPSIGYGASEASPGVTHLPPGMEPLEDGEIGFPLKQLRVALQNDGLRFSGPSLCMATIQNKQLQFPLDFVLPDIVTERENKRWVYQARSKWFINRGGEKFSLEKIEQEIFKTTNIEILAFPIKDLRLGEDLGFLLQSSTQEYLDKKQMVYSWLHRLFGRNFNQENSMNISELPYNENLKKDRKTAMTIFAKSKHQDQSTKS